jgi:hypothetical protein
MSYVIPDIAPSERSFVPPVYAITKARTQSGAVSQRLWASRPGGGTLRLAFTNIPDSDAERFAFLWDLALGTRLTLVLPSRFYDGLGVELVYHFALNGTDLVWAFAEQPRITSVAPGISSVELNFRGRGLGGSLLPPIVVPEQPISIRVNPLILSLRLSRVGIGSSLELTSDPLNLELTLSDVEITYTIIFKLIAQPLQLALALPSVNLTVRDEPIVFELEVEPLTLNLSTSTVELTVRDEEVVFGIEVEPLVLNLSIASVDLDYYCTHGVDTLDSLLDVETCFALEGDELEFDGTLWRNA